MAEYKFNFHISRPSLSGLRGNLFLGLNNPVKIVKEKIILPISI